MAKKISFLCLLIILITSLSVVTACSSDDDEDGDSADSISPIKLVPQNADTLGYLNLSEIVADNNIMALYNAIPLESNQAFQAMDAIMEKAGKDLKEAVFFASTSSLTQISDTTQAGESSGYSAIIIRGKLTQSTLIDAIEAALGETLTGTPYKQHEIHSVASGETGLTFLSEDAMVIGTIEAVKDTIDVMEGDQPAIAGDVLNSYKDLGGELLKLVMVLPQETGEGLDSEVLGQVPLVGSFMNPDTMQDLQTISLALDKKGQSAPLTLKLCFASVESADSMKESFDMITGLVEIGQSMGMIPPQAEQLIPMLEGIKADVKGTCVNVTMDFPLSSIGDILDIADSLSLPL